MMLDLIKNSIASVLMGVALCGVTHAGGASGFFLLDLATDGELDFNFTREGQETSGDWTFEPFPPPLPFSNDPVSTYDQELWAIQVLTLAIEQRSDLGIQQMHFVNGSTEVKWVKRGAGRTASVCQQIVECVAPGLTLFRSVNFELADDEGNRKKGRIDYAILGAGQFGWMPIGQAASEVNSLEDLGTDLLWNGKDDSLFGKGERFILRPVVFGLLLSWPDLDTIDLHLESLPKIEPGYHMPH